MYCFRNSPLQCGHDLIHMTTSVMYLERRSVARSATPDVSEWLLLISPSLITTQCAAENETRLLPIMSFRDAEPANLVLQSRAL
jgi:hypothetical protein